MTRGVFDSFAPLPPFMLDIQRGKKRLDNSTLHQWVSFATRASTSTSATVSAEEARVALQVVDGLHPKIIHKGGKLWRSLRPCG